MQNLSQIAGLVFEIASGNANRLKFLARSLAPLVLDSGRGPYPALEVVASRRGSAPSGERLCGIGYLAYVVERHASACLRTVGVNIWMWKSAIQEETLKTKTIQSD